MQTDPRRLGTHRDLVADPQTDVLVSAVTSWEIAIKWEIGRLPLPAPPADWVPSRIAAIAATAVDVSHRQALAVAALPPVHRDPFDRLLVVQSRDLDASLVSADPVFAGYDVRLVVV